MSPIVWDGEILLVARAAEGVLDRMWWVSALLAAEVPLAGGVARATGHPESVQAGCCCFTDQRFQLDHVWRHKPPGCLHTLVLSDLDKMHFPSTSANIVEVVETRNEHFIMHRAKRR